MTWEIKLDDAGFTVEHDVVAEWFKRFCEHPPLVLQRHGIRELKERPPHALIESQTAKHLTALDAALEEAMKAVKRDNRWEAKRSNQGGYYVGAGMIYLHAFDQAFIEAIAAFFAGDLLTALQKREEVNNSLPVAP